MPLICRYGIGGAGARAPPDVVSLAAAKVLPGRAGTRVPPGWTWLEQASRGCRGVCPSLLGQGTNNTFASLAQTARIYTIGCSLRSNKRLHAALSAGGLVCSQVAPIASMQPRAL